MDFVLDIYQKKEQMVDPELRQEARQKLRRVYDEACNELKRRGIEIPDRGEEKWAERTSPRQFSYERGKGYTREGD